MGKIAIQDVASKLIVQNGLSKKEATRFANKMFDLIREALEEEKTVKVKGLGTFKIIDVDSRESVNVYGRTEEGEQRIGLWRGNGHTSITHYLTQADA